MEEKEIYIHIGYPKTATTTLQKHFFSKEFNEFFYIGYPTSFNNPEMLKIIRYFTHYDNLYFWNNKKKIKDEIDSYIKQIKTNKIIISDEGFSVGRSFPCCNDRMSIAKKLKYIFPNAKIILTIRRQENMIKSFYLQNVKFNKLELNFSLWLKKEFEYKNYTNTLTLFKYDEIILFYNNLFKQKNICVLLFEDLHQNIDNFSARFINFLQVNNNNIQKINFIYLKKENEQLTQGIYIINNLLKNKNIKKIISFLPFKILFKNMLLRILNKKIQLKYSDDELEYLLNYYKNSNKRTQELTGLDLEKYGYSL